MDLESEKGKKLKKSDLFKVGLESKSYKIPEREFHDIMTIDKSRDGLCKIYSEEEEKANGGFRFVISKLVLEKILMYRGRSLCVNKIEVL